MRTLARLATLSLALGCAASPKLTTYQRALAVGSISKTIIDEADREFWGPFVERRTNACDPKNNPAIETKQDFDKCLGPAKANAQVEQALEVYVAAAEVLFAVLKSTASSPDEIRSAKQKALDAAIAVLELMGPEAAPYLRNLDALTRGK